MTIQSHAAFRTVLVGATAAMIGCGLRLLEWMNWRGADAWLHSEPLLATADAYAWLAGAEGTGRLAGWPLSNLLSGLSWLTGEASAWIAFWLPVALAPVSGVLVTLICARRGRYIAALAGGVLAGSSLGYLGRTRLGYADTDVIALSTLVSLAWACAIASRSLVEAVRRREFRSDTGYRLALVLIVLWASIGLYPSGYPIALAVLAAAAVYTLAATRGQNPGWLLAVLATLFLPTHFGVVGLVAGLAICGGLVLNTVFFRPLVGGALLGTALFSVILLQGDQLGQHLQGIAAYFGGPSPAPPNGWQLPSVANSIRETSETDVGAFIQRLATHWVFLVAGTVGFGLVVRRKPEYLSFLPMLALGVAGYFLGPRFAMYGAPVLGLGLGLGLPMAADMLGLRRRPACGLQALLLIAVVGVLGWRALEPEPDPALDPEHARALRELVEYPAYQGRVWEWWDQGYAAQYYAELPTFADGGSASRARVFALGQAFGATEPLEAAQVLKLGAMARATRASGSENWRAAAYQAHPLELLADMSATVAQQEIDSLGTKKRLWPDALPDEFLVVSWSTLRQAQWVNHFSRWTLTDGPGGHGRISSLQPPVQLDEGQGLLHTPNGTVPLISIDILEEDNLYRNRWGRTEGAHAIINNTNGEGVLMDSTLYGMMAVQMLLGEPGRFDEHFELVSDRFPAARIYRVR